MRHLNIPSNQQESPPKQTNLFTKYLSTPKIQPKGNVVVTNINKNDFIHFLVRISEELMLFYSKTIKPNFIFDLLSRCRASLSLVQATLILYIKSKQNLLPISKDIQEEKLFIGCIIVAHLFLMDSTYNMKSWQLITGLDIILLKRIRLVTLQLLDHRIAIDRQVYADFNAKLLHMFQLKNCSSIELISSIEIHLQLFKSQTNRPSMSILGKRSATTFTKKKRKFMEITND